MGLFSRKRTAEEPWVPAQPGACACETHVETLVDHQIPRVTDTGDVTVGALLESGSIAAEPVGPEPTYVRNCLTARTAATASAGPLTHPTFHPVVEKVLPAEEMVRVRSHIPGSVATGTCSAPSNVRCS